jgi:hypothetical protein
MSDSILAHQCQRCGKVYDRAGELVTVTDSGRPVVRTAPWCSTIWATHEEKKNAMLREVIATGKPIFGTPFWPHGLALALADIEQHPGFCSDACSAAARKGTA